MKTILIAVLNESHKHLLLLWSYKMNLVFSIVATTITFVGLSFTLSNGNPDSERNAFLLVGFLSWYFVTLIITNMAEGLHYEASAGTLEQMFISPVPIGFILMGRTLANLLISFFELSIIGGFLIVTMGIPIQWRWDIVPIAIIGIIGLSGFGFVLGGLTLVYKQVHTMANAIDGILIFLNGALSPISALPVWLIPIAQIMPSTLLISVLKDIMVQGKSISDVWANGHLAPLILHSTAYVIVGWIILQHCIRVAKREGSLGQY